MSSEKSRPYIGITGIPREGDTGTRLKELFSRNPLSTHRYMAGYLATESSLTGNAPRSQTLHSSDSLPDALNQLQNAAFTTLHYVTGNPETFATQMQTLFTRTGIYEDGLLKGLQINKVLPGPAELTKVKDAYPDLELVLQLGPAHMSRRQRNIVGLVRRYGEAVSYVLLDPSLGTGHEVTIPHATGIGNRLTEALPHLGIIYAGGITPDNVVATVEGIASHVGSHDFSIDAQSGLTIQHASRQRVLAVEKVQRYVHRARAAFNEHTH